jgi:hypothetical protein
LKHWRSSLPMRYLQAARSRNSACAADGDNSYQQVATSLHLLFASKRCPTHRPKRWRSCATG